MEKTDIMREGTTAVSCRCPLCKVVVCLMLRQVMTGAIRNA